MTNTNSTSTNATVTATNAISTASGGTAASYRDTPIGQLYSYLFGSNSNTLSRVLFIVGITILLLLTVKVVKYISNWIILKSHEKKNPFELVTQQPKFITVTSLVVSGITFVIYFFAVGLVLQEVFDVK